MKRSYRRKRSKSRSKKQSRYTRVSVSKSQSKKMANKTCGKSPRNQRALTVKRWENCQREFTFFS